MADSEPPQYAALMRRLKQAQKLQPRPQSSGYPGDKPAFIEHEPVDFPVLDEWDPQGHSTFTGAAQIPITASRR